VPSRGVHLGGAIQDAGAASLVCRVGALLCALPLAHVGETMRTLPAEPLAGVPPFVRGVAIVRGRPTPVVDAAALLSDTPPPSDADAPARRFVTVSPGDHAVMLVVDAVVGVLTLPDGVAAALPPVLQTPRLAAIAATGSLDGALLVVLEHTRLVPEDVWARLSPEGGRA
jgi:purine-binding chemotaxis protein CheW